MDHDRLATLIQSLSTARSRRRAPGGLLGGVFGVLGWQGQDDASAHKLVAPPVGHDDPSGAPDTTASLRHAARLPPERIRKQRAAGIAAKETANAATRDGQVAALSPLEGRAKGECGEVLCDPDGAGSCGVRDKGVRGTGEQPSRGGSQRRLRPYSTNRARLAHRLLAVLDEPDDDPAEIGLRLPIKIK
jgi:hypothetical protein